MGGDKGGIIGQWHVALGVGKVKVLFLPGYPVGGFCVQQIGTDKQLDEYQNMGFMPKLGELYRMDLLVTRLPMEKVGIRAIVLSPDGRSFESYTEVDADDAGPMDQISLERSGKGGGDAWFDELQVVLSP